MELEELKISWNALNDHLKDKKLMSDQEIRQLIARTGGGIRDISRLSVRMIVVSLLILAACLTASFVNGSFGLFDTLILIAIVPGLCWDVFTTRYLQRTDMEEIPLVKVISRINRFHRWMIGERLITTVFLLLAALVFFIEHAVWQHGIAPILIFAIAWGAGLGVALWFYHRNILGRIRDIKKNLNELKELM